MSIRPVSLVSLDFDTEKLTVYVHLFCRGAVSIWRPQVTQLQNLRPDEIRTFQDAGGEPLVQRTSLAANKQVC